MSGGQPDYNNYAAVYVARECLAGRELTAEGFRSLIRQTHRSVPGATDALNQTIKSVEERIAQGLPPAECMRPFTSPETLDEAMLSAGLLAANIDVANPAYRVVRAKWEERASSCFAQRRQDLIFLDCVRTGALE